MKPGEISDRERPSIRVTFLFYPKVRQVADLRKLANERTQHRTRDGYK